MKLLKIVPMLILAASFVKMSTAAAAEQRILCHLSSYNDSQVVENPYNLSFDENYSVSAWTDKNLKGEITLSASITNNKTGVKVIAGSHVLMIEADQQSRAMVDCALK